MLCIYNNIPLDARWKGYYVIETKKFCFRQLRDDIFFTPTPSSLYSLLIAWPDPSPLTLPVQVWKEPCSEGGSFWRGPVCSQTTTQSLQHRATAPSHPPSKLTPMRRVSLNKGDCFASSPRRHLSNSNNTCPRFDTSIKAERIGRRKC